MFVSPSGLLAGSKGIYSLWQKKTKYGMIFTGLGHANACFVTCVPVSP